MSNELLLPPHLYPSDFELRLQDTVGMYRPKFGYAVQQRVDFGASRWVGRAMFEKLRDSERHSLLAFLTRVGRLRSFYIPVYGEASRGGFVTQGSYGEDLSNNTFESGTTGWTFAASYDGVVANRILRLTRNAVGSAANAVRNTTLLTVQSGAPRIFRAILYPGKASFEDLELRMGTTAGAEDIVDQAITAGQYGLWAAWAAVAGTALSCTVRDDDTAGQAVGDYFEIPWMSSSRVGRVNGASQVGSALITDDWPASQSDFIAAGDFINIVLPTQHQLVRLTAPMHTDSSGNGYLQFEPALYESPANNAPIVVRQPLLKAVLSEVPTIHTTPPGYQSDVEIIFEGVFG